MSPKGFWDGAPPLWLTWDREACPIRPGPPAFAGFLMTGTRAMSADVPIISSMFAAYAGASDAYVRLAPARERILFVRRDNPASLRAQEKIGMRQVASFLYGGSEFAVLSYLS